MANQSYDLDASESYIIQANAEANKIVLRLRRARQLKPASQCCELRAYSMKETVSTYASEL